MLRRETAEPPSSPSLSQEEGENDPPENKYSEAYFQDRIQTLQKQIRQAIPTKEDIDSDRVFASVLQSLDAAKQTLETTKSVVAALETEQKKHPGDDGWVDLTLVGPTKLAVQEAQGTVDRLKEAGTNAGCALVKASGLLDDRYHDHDEHEHEHDNNSSANNIATTNNNNSIFRIERELLECTVLIQATPKKLANWCAESPDVNRPLLDRFLLGADM